MNATKNHYDHHLAGHYSWLFGGVKGNLEKNRSFFNEHQLTPKSSGEAIDLGSGSGFQSIPLAEMGYSVSAIDFSEKLLEELQEQKRGLSIKTWQDDLLNFQRYCSEKSELCVCMGDTLTHLDSHESVSKLFGLIYQSLEKEGKLVLTFRDFSRELKGTDRFIPVQNSDDVIFTCFLEYMDEIVNVHDLIYQKEESGWSLKKSSYRKIRITFEWVTKILENHGFLLNTAETTKGIITIIATRN